MVLNIGDSAPNFVYITEDGKKSEFHDIHGKKIVFFFPEAFTAGCTAQACSMQESYDDLKANGTTEIVGISMDSPEKQKKFKEKHNLDYPLVSDSNGSISKSYDVYNNFLLKKYSGRVTYTIENNKITHVLNSGMTGNKAGPLKDIGNEILNFIKLD